MFSEECQNSRFAKEAIDYIDETIDKLRRRNDYDMSETKTAGIRGEIRALSLLRKKLTHPGQSA